MKTDSEVITILFTTIININPDIDPLTIDPDLSLKDQCGLDSMDFLDIVMQLKKNHQLDIPQPDYPKLSTLRSATEYLIARFNEAKND